MSVVSSRRSPEVIENSPIISSTASQTVPSLNEITLGIGATDLAQTLDGGQAFLWRRQSGGGYRGPFGAQVVEFFEAAADVGFRTDSGTLTCDLVSDVKRYFDSGLDVERLKRRLGDEPSFGQEILSRPLIRVLRQDPWECLVAFICSQNSNIPRIKTMIASVGGYGRSIGSHPWEFEFPTPQQLAEVGEARLREDGLGYRAKHLSQTAEVIARGEIDLTLLRGERYVYAKDALTSLPGVGPKVADCVLAYSLGKGEAFPVDVHVRRAVRRIYGTPEEMTNEDMGDWARDRFGEWAAIAQLYIFRNQINEVRRT